ncbi:hypothetical protein KA005_43805 [bacterium]|nr:hypothetical protein [bacterium]
MKKVVTFMVILVVGSMVGGMAYANNHVINDGFDSDLSEWSFEDISHTSSCSNPYAEALYDSTNQRAAIHTHSAYGAGTLTQELTTTVLPKRLAATYENSPHYPSGSCNCIIISFFDQYDDVVAYFYYIRDSSVPMYSNVRLIILGKTIDLKFDRKYSSGTVEWIFDLVTNEVRFYWNTELLHTEAITMDYEVSKVELKGSNSCCDGRNDGYAYFDDIVIEPVSGDTDTDSDGDGVINEDDECPGTPEDDVVDSDGCSIAQICPSDHDWKNHGAYVKCVAHTAKFFVAEGLIVDEEKCAIVSEAAQSDVGKK